MDLDPIQKFRAWDLEKKKWIETGFHLIGEVTVFEMLRTYSIKDYNNIVVSMYTGLDDRKKANIYAGDILRFQHCHLTKLDVVKFCVYDDNEGYAANQHYGYHVKWKTLIDAVNDGVEVVGNIWEHPHLVGG